MSELTGIALDVAVARVEGRTVVQDPMGFHDGSYWIWEMMPSDKGGTDIVNSTMLHIGYDYSPSTKWRDGGAIIDRERIGLLPDDDNNSWVAILNDDTTAIGGTALTAAMRAYVASKSLS